MSFPSSPLNGQTALVGGINYQYSTSTNAWTRLASDIAVTSANIGTLRLGGGTGRLTSSEVYDVDDLSNYTDGYTNSFQLRYNGTLLSISNPWNLQVTVNGIDQSAFVINSDTVWQGHVLSANKGYTIDTNGNLKFADSVPINSQLFVRTTMGTNTQAAKRYPFQPLDILTGS